MKAVEDHAHHWLAVARGGFQSRDRTAETMRQPYAAKNGSAERETISLMHLVGNDDPIVGCRRCRIFFPEAFRRLHLGRLITKHRPVEDIPDEKLTRHGHGRETDAERDCPAPKGFMFAAQQIPGAHTCDKKRSGDEG